MKRNAFILSLFLLAALFFTFPLILDIAHKIPGSESTDEPFGVLWFLWAVKFSWTHHISIKSFELIRFPFGANLFSSGIFIFIPNFMHYVFSTFSPYVLSYNLQVLINFILTGFVTYLFLFKITRNICSSLFAGIIFAFCPQMFARVWQHPGMSTFQWIPFSFLFAFKLKEKPNLKNTLFFVISLFIVFSADLHIAYLIFIGLLSYLVYVILSGIGNPSNTFRYVKYFILASLCALIFALPQYYFYISKIFSGHSTAASTYNLYARPFEDLFMQSARPLSYFLPALIHPIFGKFTEQFIGSSLYGKSFTEHTLYLGWTPLILTFIAIKKWRKERKAVEKSGTVPKGDSPYKENFYIGFFIFLAIAAWLFSQPPWWRIGHLKIYMPSFFIYKLVPMVRAYCRFGILLMFAVAILAGFGLKYILERFKSQKTKIAFTLVFCGLVLFEFWNWPLFKVIDVSKIPAVYYWIKGQPGDFVIAEYPLDTDSPNEMYKFYQTKHEKKIINGTIPETYANKVAQTITKLSDADTASKLKWMGVKYVIVHKQKYLDTELAEDKDELTKIPKNTGLKFITGFLPQECPQRDIMCVQKTGPIDVYEITANPIEPDIK